LFVRLAVFVRLAGRGAPRGCLGAGALGRLVRRRLLGQERLVRQPPLPHALEEFVDRAQRLLLALLFLGPVARDRFGGDALCQLMFDLRLGIEVRERVVQDVRTIE
jgi:hypothetical protein